ncbi:MAG: hypothetical protein QNJ97_00475 [Myxococcota bacterium]|nr:hypothetical protein [Myxococcota bacterium]
MAVFEDTAKMYEVLGTLFRNLKDHPKVGPKVIASGMTVRFVISDPDGEIWLTPGDDKKGYVICGGFDATATIEMRLSGDTCHKFWMKQVTLPVALAKRQIKAKGPMNKILTFIPILKHAYKAYPAIAREHGIEI